MLCILLTSLSIDQVKWTTCLLNTLMTLVKATDDMDWLVCGFGVTLMQWRRHRDKRWYWRRWLGENIPRLQVLATEAGKVGCRWMEREEGVVLWGDRGVKRRVGGILKMQQWGAGQGFTVIRWQNGGGLKMRERGHTQCHCRRVICKCQSRGLPGEQQGREGRGGGAEIERGRDRIWGVLHWE